MNSSTAAEQPTQPPRGPWQRLHAALMPDYNRPATAYWWTVVLLGLGAWAAALVHSSSLAWPALLQVAGGVLLAMLMALFPLRIPRTNQSFALGDVFIFLLLLAHGPAAGCLAAGLEGLVSSWRSSRRWTTRLGTASIASLSTMACGTALQAATSWLPTTLAAYSAWLCVAGMAYGAVYATCNVVLMSTVGRLKRNERLQLSDFLATFGWIGGASAVAGAIAVLLLITQRQAGIGVMLSILPTIGLLLTTLHFFTRQQEADVAARDAAAQALAHKAELAQSQALQREAELAARHVQALETSERRFHRAFTHASIGMALVGADGQIQLANPALSALFGVGASSLEGQSFLDHVSGVDAPRFRHTLELISRGRGQDTPLEVCCRRQDGAEVWVSISCSLFSDTDSVDISLILQIQDITARRSAEAELHHRAFHDKLTGLPNRDRFHQALAAAIDHARHSGGAAFAVMFLDFDRFKLINDSKGHGVGDEFLVAASERLARCLRRTDVLARLGGDEFAILATGLASDQEAVDLADRLLNALHEPLRLRSMDISATASIGITFSSMGYARPEDMLRDADIAMYRAKLDGKARYALFDVKLHKELASRVRLEADLREALAQGTMAIAFQPLYALASGRLMGFEALSRWNHPELGPISPGTFIPIAEESGLITQLTEFMFRASCRHLADWLQAHPDLDHLHVHVNSAGRDLADPAFVQRIQAALQSSGLQARHLVVELTENILMSQLSAAMATLEALRDLGIGLSVDDFGTGYSSLSHLSMLPIDSLKIDMSFVRQLRAGTKEEAVVRAIVLLGTSLGKTIIAEGIETEDQMDLLHEIGCHLGQGYFLSRPLAPEDAGRLLRSQAPGRPASSAPPALRLATAA